MTGFAGITGGRFFEREFEVFLKMYVLYYITVYLDNTVILSKQSHGELSLILVVNVFVFLR